jgi:hypothetical protein
MHVLLTPRAVSSVEAVAELRRRAEPCCRGVCPLRHVPAATTALGSFVVPRAARRCSPCLKPSPETLYWVPPASPAAARRQPSSAAGQTLTRVLRRRIKIRRA